MNRPISNWLLEMLQRWTFQCPRVLCLSSFFRIYLQFFLFHFHSKNMLWHFRWELKWLSLEIHGLEQDFRLGPKVAELYVQYKSSINANAANWALSSQRERIDCNRISIWMKNHKAKRKKRWTLKYTERCRRNLEPGNIEELFVSRDVWWMKKENLEKNTISIPIREWKYGKIHGWLSVERLCAVMLSE